MMVHSRYAGSMFLVCGLLVALHSPADTLRQTIAEKGIDPSGLASPNLDKEIIGRSELDEADLFLMAYYLHDGTQTLQGLIQIEMLDKNTHSWTHKEVDIRSLESGGDMSICAIDRTKNGFYLYAHINPSAGVTIILSPSLELRGTVYGSFLGDYANGVVVYSKNTVHFAPTHSEEVSLYGPTSKAGRSIYPLKPYRAVRLGYIAKVKAAYDKRGRQWFMSHNHHGNPELFTNYINTAATNDATDSLAFVASFDNEETLDEEDLLKFTYLGGIRHALKEHPLDTGLTKENAALFCVALWRGFVSARGHGVYGCGNKCANNCDARDCLLASFDSYPEIRDMIKALVLNLPFPPEGTSWQEHLLVLDPRWASPDTWRIVEKVVGAPPRFTEVVYVYRDVCTGGDLEYREVLLDEVKRRLGDVPLSKLLEPEVLQAIFETSP